MKRNLLLSNLGAFALSLMLVAPAAAGGSEAQAAQSLVAPRAVLAIHANVAGVDAPTAVADAGQIEALGAVEVILAGESQEASAAECAALDKKAATDPAFANTAKNAGDQVAAARGAGAGREAELAAVNHAIAGDNMA